jgi:hypothetical protein
MKSRRGVTLLELVLSITAAVVLLAGMAGIVRISSSTLRSQSEVLHSDPIGETERFKEDLCEATAVTDLTSQQLSLRVPDRNGDATEELVRYRVNGLSLERSENTSSYSPTSVSGPGLNFDWRTSAVAPVPPYLESTERVWLQSYSRSTDWGDDDLWISRPADVKAGDTLIYAVAIDHDERSSFAMSDVWQTIATTQSGNEICICSGWKIATAAEPTWYQATWTGDHAAVGWIFRLSGCAAVPIYAFESRGGWADVNQSVTPAEPYSIGFPTSNNLAILRVIAFQRRALINRHTGLPRSMHVPLLETPSWTPEVQSVATFRQLTAFGQEGLYAQYVINASTHFVALTVALAKGN